MGFFFELDLNLISQLIICTIILAIFIRTRRKKYNLPPGPWGLPIFGNLLMFRKTNNVHVKLNELGKVYGPVFFLKLGSKDCVVLNQIDAIYEALVKKQVDFAGRPHSLSIDILTEGGKDIVFGDYGATWRLHRKLAYKAVKNYVSGSGLIEKVENATAQAINIMAKQQTNPFDPYYHINLIVFNIIAGICFGKCYDMDNKEFIWLVKQNEDFLEVSGNGLGEDFLPWLKYFPSQSRTRMKKFTKDFISFFSKKYEEHRKAFDPGNTQNFIDELLLAQMEAKQGKDVELLSQLTDTHMVQTLIDIFGAGTSTSNLVLYWAVLYMVAYPDIQKRLHAEIDAKLGKERKLADVSKSDFPYCWSILCETMRLSSVVPLSVPHATTCDTKIGNFDIPKGFMILTNLWAIHRDPLYWEDPEKFDPDRFLDETGNVDSKPTSFLPFSAGRRVCLGEYIAKPEMLMIFVALFQQFKFSLPPGVTAELEGFGSAFGNIPKRYQIIIEQR